TTESGLQYEIIKSTEGEKPRKSSVVRVIYTGNFTDGRIFDRSTEEGGAYIPLENVIPGWTEGLMLMSPGSIYRLYVPSKLAYGKDGIQGVIAPYSTLVFMVELLEIIDEPEDEES
ncbi:FKBP-type peptidyl-prolyl cis-trans isomerase, partial [Treponema sp. R80B11-R83G3]